MKRRVIAIVLAMMTSAISAPLAVADDGPTDADRFVDAINETRLAEGLPPLDVYWDLVDDAVAHTADMAATDTLYHNPALASVTTGWYSLGENVGYGWSVESLHEAFLDSPGHRANILGDYNYVGVGAEWASPTRLWVTVVFMKGPEGLGEAAWEGSFWDDDDSIHRSNIDAIAALGITRGCNPPANDMFCPNGHVTRGQMSAFLRRILDLPSVNEDFFIDDGDSIFEGDIQALTAAGIGFGCAPDRYCPDAGLTRAEMAEMLVRAFGYTNPSGGDFFADDAGNTFEASINMLKSAEVTKGCNPPANDHFCPDGVVTRAEMATFLVRALGI